MGFTSYSAVKVSNINDGNDGQSLYTWIRYADTPESGMSEYPTNKKYIGIAYNKPVQNPSAVYKDYTWSLMTGKSIVSISQLYYLADTNNIEDIPQPPTNWSTEPPVWNEETKQKYVWTCSKVIYDNPPSIDYISIQCDATWEGIKVVTNSVKEVESKVDAVEKKITNKVWRDDVIEVTDLETGEVISKTLESYIAQHTIDLNGITSRVEKTETDLYGTGDDAKQGLIEEFSETKQSYDGFVTTIKGVYGSEEGFVGAVTEVRQKAGEIETELRSATGEGYTLKQTFDGVKEEIKGVDGKVTEVKKTADGVQLEVENARGKGNASLSVRLDGMVSEVVNDDGFRSAFDQKANQIKTELTPPSAIRYIRDWLSGSTTSTTNEWVECRVIAGTEEVIVESDVEGIADEGDTVEETETIKTVEKNIAKELIGVLKDEQLNQITQPSNMSVYTDDEILKYDETGAIIGNSYISASAGKKCIELDLGTIRTDIDYIQVFHYYADERVYNHKLEVSKDGKTWIPLYDSEISGGYTETQDGKVHIISETYLSNTFSRITQTIDNINSTVKTQDGRISQLEINGSGFVLKTELATATDEIKEDYDNLNTKLYGDGKEVKGEFAEIRGEIDGITTTVQGKTDIETVRSEINQSSTEWQALFSSIGMGDYPDKNRSVKMSADGLEVIDLDNNIRTIMSPTEFAGYCNEEKVFWIDKDITKVARLLVSNGIDYSTIKYLNVIYNTSSGNIGALTHIKSGGNS